LGLSELDTLLVAAGLGPPAEHALISLLALNGLHGRRLEASDSPEIRGQGGLQCGPGESQ